MTTIGFPRPRLVVLQELAARVLDSHAIGCEGETLARDLLAGFFDACMRAGLDGVIAELGKALPALDVTDRLALAEDPSLRAALVDKLGDRGGFDGGPRSTKPRQLADALVAALSLTLIDEPARTIALADDVRTEVTAALAGVIDVELAVPRIRERVIATARERCDAHHLAAFERIAAQLDDRGMSIVRQPKVPLDALQAVKRVLVDARNAIIEKAAHAAIDRAKAAIARVDAEAAARIDRPITLRLSPRDVAIERVKDPRITKVAGSVVQSLLDSLTELAELAWRPPERPVRVYAPNQTFAVGDLLDHPKFGRGSVAACDGQRIGVDFPDGRHTLVHLRPSK